jgi:peptidoglycan hydrolase-like protein with peptidoglycan-binding domain
VRQLTRLLDAQRLSESSEVAVIDGKPPISLYREVIFRIQTQLKARGLYDGEMTSEFDDATQTALRAFQKAASIPVTGVPGQESLRRLFYPGANSPAPKS